MSIPDRFDIVLLDLQPNLGTEIDKRRPCLVLTPFDYNKSGKVIICPISSTKRRIGVEVEITGKTKGTVGVILCDQIKSYDWRVRQFEIVDKLEDPTVYDDLLEIIRLLITP